jgi:peptide/nickel transport system permease protein
MPSSTPASDIRATPAPGAPARRVRHILPNILPGLIVYATLFMANAVLLEAELSFLGLGVQPPTASWGLMVSTGRDVLLVAPHVATGAGPGDDGIRFRTLTGPTRVTMMVT